MPRDYRPEIKLDRFTRVIQRTRVFCRRFYVGLSLILNRILCWLWLLDQPDVAALSRRLESVVERPRKYREILVPHSEKIDLIGVSKQHTHRRSAMYRSSANQFMNDLVTRAGFHPYNVSRSNHDLNGGSRFFYHQKDLGIPFKQDEIQDDSCLIFCDVDYYCDINSWATLFRPILMYTAVPTSVAHRTDEYNFYLRNNRMVYNVSGGGRYEHQLWDYVGDTFSVVDDDGNLCVFNIEQKVVEGDEQHRIVWLIPMARVPCGYWEELFKASCPIKRKITTMGSLTYLYNAITDNLSIKREDGVHAINLKGRVYEAIRKRIANKEAAPVVADIERLLLAANEPDFSVTAPLLFELITDNVPNG